MKHRAILTLVTLGALSAAPSHAAPAAKVGEKEALAIGTEAYVYGYPLVSMEMTKRKLTRVAKPAGLKGAPINQFAHAREFVSAGFTDVVAPNNDTLYSQAWLDLSREPIVLHIPESQGRYFLMPMLSGWTEVFASPGTRTTGAQQKEFAIVGPSFHGKLPAGLTAIRAPTNMVWILGRTYSSGTPADLARVHAFQDALSLTPLSAYGTRYTPPEGAVEQEVDRKKPVVDQVNGMDAQAFFSMLAAQMKDDPPARADAPLVAKLARIGIVPGQPFDMKKLDPAVARGLKGAPKAGLQAIKAHEQKAGDMENGWLVSRKTGRYGTDYLQRAYVALIGLGANRHEDAMYPVTRVDERGHRLNGTQRYVLHFNAGAMPPVQGFWSVTMYDEKMFFVDNALDRYAIHSVDQLQHNADGSVDLYIQSTSPADEKVSNWLPAPKGEFALMLRMYWPKESAVKGTWEPPGVRRMP
ncbi:DUF1254 domain-containing protein [Chondromyces crocatus]|uniref:DUF1254 domain-containing protein n=1 Tax=Chondromyces crocatus TaxID=52 RepID=A0A0K1EQW1_CHOCO|nr:DUF1254 domain-containing protein [Chondromyces crocatus]AKT43315.1 uncharacterized protein CMC5_075470 [Chondromyces crocatus]